jgi:hypothetical protein
LGLSASLFIIPTASATEADYIPVDEAQGNSFPQNIVCQIAGYENYHNVALMQAAYGDFTIEQLQSMFSDLAPGVDPSAAILNIPEVSAAVSAALKAI